MIIENSYNILWLDITSTQKQIIKRWKDILKYVAIWEIPDFDNDLYFVKEYRNEIYIKEAIDNLSNPKNRLINIFFWLDIENEDDKKVFELINNKDFIWAISLLKKSDNEKNIAILYSLVLLDKDISNIELDDTPLELTEKLIIMFYKLSKNEKFWKLFEQKFYLHDDLSTDKKILKEFKSNLGEYLSDLFYDISKNIWDDNVLKIFNKHFSNTKGSKTNNEVDIIYWKLTKIVEKLEWMDISEDWIFDDDEKEELKKSYKEINSLLKKIKDIWLYDDSKTLLIRDNLVKSLRVIMLDLNNNLSKWIEALKIINFALKIVWTDWLKSKLESDKRVLKDNTQYNVCYFCEKEESCEECWIKVKMYKIFTNKEKYKWSWFVVWEELDKPETKLPETKLIEINVPKCSICNKIEEENSKKSKYISIFSWILFFLFLLWIENEWWIVIFYIIIVLMFVYIFYKILLYIITKFKLNKSYNRIINFNSNNFCLIKDKISEWWKIWWEEEVAKVIKPNSLWTLNWFWVSIYWDTTYFTMLWIPIIPISTWYLDDLGWNQYQFYWQKEMVIWKKWWRNIILFWGIWVLLIVFLVSIFESNSRNYSFNNYSISSSDSNNIKTNSLNNLNINSGKKITSSDIWIIENKCWSNKCEFNWKCVDKAINSRCVENDVNNAWKCDLWYYEKNNYCWCASWQYSCNSFVDTSSIDFEIEELKKKIDNTYVDQYSKSSVNNYNWLIGKSNNLMTKRNKILNDKCSCK